MSSLFHKAPNTGLAVPSPVATISFGVKFIKFFGIFTSCFSVLGRNQSKNLSVCQKWEGKKKKSLLKRKNRQQQPSPAPFQQCLLPAT